MKPTITFRSLEKADIPLLERWHEDGELRSRYGGSEWAEKLLELVHNDPNRYCWIVESDGGSVGYVDLEVYPREQIGWLGLVVNPKMRSQGFGRSILQSFSKLPEVQSLKELRAGIEEDNEASTRCFCAAGFRQLNEKPDCDGIINLSYVMQ